MVLRRTKITPRYLFAKFYKQNLYRKFLYNYLYLLYHII